MKKLKFKKNEEALVIVAHPDDETIWLSGFILKHPKINWTILSLCRATDPDRAPKFRKVCRALGARAIITDLDDEGRVSERQALPEIRRLIKQKIGEKKFSARGGPAFGWDFLFTHGANGEYGHPRHKSVHQVVKKMAKNGELKAKKVFFFNYKKISKYHLAPAKNSDFILKLTAKEFKKKKSLMAKIYGFAPDGIDANYCTNIESFKINK